MKIQCASFALKATFEDPGMVGCFPLYGEGAIYENIL